MSAPAPAGAASVSARIGCGAVVVAYLVGLVPFVLWAASPPGLEWEWAWLLGAAIAAAVLEVLAIILAIVALVGKTRGKGIAIATIVASVVGFVGVAALLLVAFAMLTPGVR